MKYLYYQDDELDSLENVEIISKEILDSTIVDLSSSAEIAIDIETTGLNTWNDKILLCAFYRPEADYVLVVGGEERIIAVAQSIPWGKITAVAHNAAFELKFLYQRGVDIPNIYCTMIAEAKLLQGADIKLDIISTHRRRRVDIPEGMDKDIRSEFTNPDWKIESKHVIYNACDVETLFKVKAQQERMITKLNMHFFVISIHMRLIRSLVMMELEGMVHDSEKWIAHAKSLEAEANQITANLDLYLNDKINWKAINTDYADLDKKITRKREVLQSRIYKLDQYLQMMEEKGKMHLKTYMRSYESRTKARLELSSLDDDVALKENYTGINYSSTKQVLAALEEMKVSPMPMAKSNTTHKMQPSISNAAREKWLLENPNHEHKEFIEFLDKYKNIKHNINSFGEAWVEKYLNPKTGKVHTTYSNLTSTGRLRSGKAAEGLYNSQQIPADINYRTCFTVEKGYKVATLDYSGAELCFMAKLAGDERLYELSQGDMHSYFANACWKAIYEHRGEVWTPEKEISKEQNKYMRTGHKPMTFGCVYGLKPPKAAAILNVSEKEGSIAIKITKNEIPKTFTMVEDAVDFIKVHGYVIHNTRTNSRRWFPEVIVAKNNQRDLTYTEKRNVEGGGRNTRIQGSQGDLVMEAIVWIDRWIDLYKIDASVLLTVHDRQNCRG